MQPDEIETLKFLLEVSNALEVTRQKIVDLQQENAILRTRIAGLEDDCNEYAETVWSEFDTKGGDFVPPYPDNPLTKERKGQTQ